MPRWMMGDKSLNASVFNIRISIKASTTNRISVVAQQNSPSHGINTYILGVVCTAREDKIYYQKVCDNRENGEFQSSTRAAVVTELELGRQQKVIGSRKFVMNNQEFAIFCDKYEILFGTLNERESVARVNCKLERRWLKAAAAASAAAQEGYIFYKNTRTRA